MQLLRQSEKDKQRKVSRGAKSIQSGKCRVSPALFIKRASGVREKQEVTEEEEEEEE